MKELIHDLLSSVQPAILSIKCLIQCHEEVNNHLGQLKNKTVQNITDDKFDDITTIKYSCHKPNKSQWMYIKSHKMFIY